MHRVQGPGPESPDSQWNGEGSGLDNYPDEIDYGCGLRILGWRPRDCGTSRRSRQ